MKTNLVYYILLLLYREGAVRLPGLGRLLIEPEDEEPNTDTSILNPPASKVRFQSSRKKNGRVLINYLAYQSGVSKGRSRTLVREFTSAISGSIKNGQSVEVEHFGLFTSEKGKLSFKPDPGIVNARYEGLEPVGLKEIALAASVDTQVREPEPPEVVKPVQVITEEPPLTPVPSPPGSDARNPSNERPVSDVRDAGSRVGQDKTSVETSTSQYSPWKRIPLAIPLTISILVLVSVFAFLQYQYRSSMMYPAEAYNRAPVTDSFIAEKKHDTTESDRVEFGTGKQNQNEPQHAPPTEADPIEEPSDAVTEQQSENPASDTVTDIPPATDDGQISEDSGMSTDSDSAESMTPAAEIRSQDCIVIVGAFGVQSNVDRMLARLRDMGFVPTTHPKGQLTQVGVPGECNSKEIDSILTVLQKDVESQSWIFSPH